MTDTIAIARRPGAALSEAEAQPLVDAAMALITTQVPAQIASGAEKETNCRRAQELNRRASKAAAPAKPAKPAKAKKAAAKPVTRKARFTPGTRIVLKANKPIRARLMAAATSLGGTRLSPVGFASYTDFLGGVTLDKDGNATVTLIPVKGSDPIRGKNVKLIVKGGVPSVK